jgi:hypothetical protein
LKRLILDLLKKVKRSPQDPAKSSPETGIEVLQAQTSEGSSAEPSTEPTAESKYSEFTTVEASGDGMEAVAAVEVEVATTAPPTGGETLSMPADFIENAMPDGTIFNPLEPVVPHGVSASSFFQSDPGVTLNELRAIFDGPDWSKLMRNARDGGATSILACRVLDKTMALLQHGNRHVERMLDAAQNVRATTGQLASIAEDIKQVSNQTRIVSINAGIEANRAGLHGRTFQVVAQQMTMLSEDARQLTLSIDSKLHGVNEKISINRELCGEVGKLFGDMNSELGEFRRMMMRVEELAEIQVEQLDHIEHIIIEPAIKRDVA